MTGDDTCRVHEPELTPSEREVSSTCDASEASAPTAAKRRRPDLERALRQIGRTPEKRRHLLALVCTPDGCALTTRQQALETFERGDLPEVATAIRAAAVPPGSILIITIGDLSGVSIVVHPLTRKPAPPEKATNR